MRSQIYYVLFASHFSLVYNTSNLTLNNYTYSQISFDRYLLTHLPCNVSLSFDENIERFNSLRKSHSKVPDGIAVVLFLYRQSSSIPTFSFILSLQRAIFLTIWKISHVMSIFKTEYPTDIVNYCPISGLPLISKLFELLIFKRI